MGENFLLPSIFIIASTENCISPKTMYTCVVEEKVFIAFSFLGRSIFWCKMHILAWWYYKGLGSWVADLISRCYPGWIHKSPLSPKWCHHKTRWCNHNLKWYPLVFINEKWFCTRLPQNMARRGHLWCQNILPQGNFASFAWQNRLQALKQGQFGNME